MILYGIYVAYKGCKLLYMDRELIYGTYFLYIMIMSSNGKIFHITGLLCRESPVIG